MASKKDIRPVITFACGDCKERNYTSQKNRRNDPGRMELKNIVRVVANILSTAKRSKFIDCWLLIAKLHD